MDRQREVLDQYAQVFDETVRVRRELKEALQEATLLLGGEHENEQQQQQHHQHQSPRRYQTNSKTSTMSHQTSPSNSIASSMDMLPRTNRFMSMSRVGTSFANVSRSLSTRYPPTSKNNRIMSTPRFLNPN